MSLFCTTYSRSAWFIGEMASRLRGIGNTENGAVRTPRINPEDLGDISVAFPSPEEQRCIADFLDVETGRIDTLVDKKRHLLTLLEERIDSRILTLVGSSRLASQRLNPRAFPIRRLLRNVRGPVSHNSEVVTAFRDGQVVAD